MLIQIRIQINPKDYEFVKKVYKERGRNNFSNYAS